VRERAVHGKARAHSYQNKACMIIKHTLCV